MALIFPDNPETGDVVIINDRTWEWDGERWLKLSDIAKGDTGFTGSRGFVGSVGFGFAGSRGLAGGAPRNNQTIIGDGLSSRFNLDRPVGNSIAIFVIVNGLVLIPNNDYVIENSDELLIYETPNELADIEVRYFDEAGYTGSIGETGYKGSTGFFGSNGLAQVYISPIAPPYEEIIDGELWWDTQNGILNIWYTDEETWVGIQHGPRGFRGYAGSLGYTGSRGFTGSFGYTGSQGIIGLTGYDGSRGYDGSIGYTGSIGIGYNGSVGFTGSIGSIGFVGSAGMGGDGDVGFTGSIGIGYNGSVGFTGSKGEDASLIEDYFFIAGEAINYSLDILVSHVFNINPSGDFSINLINVSSISVNKTTTIVIIIKQGSTPYKINNLSFSGVTQTVIWQGTTIPNGNANKTDAISFTILRDPSGYTILGQLIGFG